MNHPIYQPGDRVEHKQTKRVGTIIKPNTMVTVAWDMPTHPAKRARGISTIAIDGIRPAPIGGDDPCGR